MQDALKDAGLTSTVYAAMLVMSIPHNPWNSGRWWNEIQESMDKHFERNSHQNQLFQAMFPKLQWEMQRYGRGYKLTAEPDSEQAQCQVWAWLKGAVFVLRKFLVKLKTRW